MNFVDGDVEFTLREAAEDIVAAALDDTRALKPLLVDPSGALGVLTWMRARGAATGKQLFVFLARSKRLNVDEADWPELPEGAREAFELLARLCWGYVLPRAAAAEAVEKVVMAAKPKVTDTIFERYSDRPAMERTGGLDLSPGQPTSTAQVTVIAPMPPRPLDPGDDLRDAESDDARVAAEVRARMGGAPPPDIFEPMRIDSFEKGQRILGEVLISRRR